MDSIKTLDDYKEKVNAELNALKHIEERGFLNDDGKRVLEGYKDLERELAFCKRFDDFSNALSEAFFFSKYRGVEEFEPLCRFLSRFRGYLDDNGNPNTIPLGEHIRFSEIFEEAEYDDLRYRYKMCEITLDEIRALAQERLNKFTL